MRARVRAYASVCERAESLLAYLFALAAKTTLSVCWRLTPLHRLTYSSTGGRRYFRCWFRYE